MLYESIKRSHLEYVSVFAVWNPHKGLSKALGRVQMKVTKLVSGLKKNVTRKELKLPTLKHRRIRGDMTVHKLLTNKYDNTVYLDINFDTKTRAR